jgi:hypothetical protein
MELNMRQRVGLFIILALIATLVLGFTLIKGKMQHDLWEVCSLAQLAYPQATEPVEALLVWIQSPTHSLEERNRGVWALGHLRDERALSVLEQYYHGGECDHENEVCQRELKKALNLIKGEGRSLFKLSPP